MKHVYGISFVLYSLMELIYTCVLGRCGSKLSFEKTFAWLGYLGLKGPMVITEEYVKKKS